MRQKALDIFRTLTALRSDYDTLGETLKERMTWTLGVNALAHGKYCIDLQFETASKELGDTLISMTLADDTRLAVTMEGGYEITVHDGDTVTTLFIIRDQETDDPDAFMFSTSNADADCLEESLRLMDIVLQKLVSARKSN